jgi:hypothetical protein
MYAVCNSIFSVLFSFFSVNLQFRIDAAVFDASSSHVRVVSKYLAKVRLFDELFFQIIFDLN